MSEALVFYYVDPDGDQRRRLVLPNPTAEEKRHYKEVMDAVEAGATPPAIGLFGVRQAEKIRGDLDERDLGRAQDVLADPAGIVTVRTEEISDTDDQGDLLVDEVA